METRQKLLVISRRDDRPEYDTAHSMAKTLSQVATTYTVDACFLEDLVFVFDGQSLNVVDAAGNFNVADYDGLFMIGWFKTKMLEEVALSVAVFAEANGIKLLNTETRINRSKSKVSQYVHAALHGISTTPFVFQLDTHKIADYLEAAHISYPFIFKSVSASRGKSNYLVESAEHLRQIIAAEPEAPFIAQTYVPNDGDYRIIVIGGGVKLVIHRKAVSGSHLNNTSQGGEATIADMAKLDRAMLDQSVKIAKLLNREITGVDMIVSNDDGRFYFLEANNMPQLSTGSYVAEKSAVLNDYFTEWLA